MEFWLTAGIGIILFAIATAILYVIGLKKEMAQNSTLSDLLLNKGAARIVTYLKKNESVSKKEAKNLVDGMKTSVFYSKQRAMVNDSSHFTDILLDHMLKKGIIEKKQQAYYLKKEVTRIENVRTSSSTKRI